MVVTGKSPLVVASFTLEAAQIAWLTATARRERRSRSFVVREALDREMARVERVEDAPDARVARRRLRDLRGCL